MNTSLKYALFMALIVVLAVWALWQQSQPDSAPQALPKWGSFDQARAADIVIRSGAASSGRNVHLLRRDKQWLVLQGEHDDTLQVKQEPLETPADKQAVEHLLGDLAGMRVGRVVSHQPAHFSRLSVDEAGGTAVTIRDADGDVLLDILIGKAASDLVSTYVRRRGEDVAVTVNRSLSWQVKRLPKAWQAHDEAESIPPNDAAVDGALAKDGYSQH